MSKPEPNYAPMYCAMYPDLAKEVRKFGYALAVHGSVARDFDLVCIPWIAKPAQPEEVVAALLEKFAFREIDKITIKEHNRKVFTLLLGFGHCFADLSFMPIVEENNA